MLCDCDNPFTGIFTGGTVNPARQRLDACGYDPTCYISTAGLSVTPYTDNNKIIARIGGNTDKLIPTTDDDNTGSLNQAILNNVIANVTTQINGLIASAYPVPLQRIGTVCVVQVATVSTNGLGTIVTLNTISAGAYLTAPASPNTPVYLKALSFCEQEHQLWNNFQPRGSGASFTVTFSNPTTVTVTTPITATNIVVTSGGLGYTVGDLLVLVGGSSFVPDKITNAATTLCCYELLRRRLVPDEKNQFENEMKDEKKELLEIGNGDKSFDGNYRSFYSPGAAWVQDSVLRGNSL